MLGIKTGLCRTLVVALVSIPLGFLLSMFGYGYPFPTLGMYVAARLKPLPSAEWSIFGRMFCGDCRRLGLLFRCHLDSTRPVPGGGAFIRKLEDQRTGT